MWVFFVCFVLGFFLWYFCTRQKASAIFRGFKIFFIGREKANKCIVEKLLPMCFIMFGPKMSIFLFLWPLNANFSAIFISCIQWNVKLSIKKEIVVHLNKFLNYTIIIITIKCLIAPLFHDCDSRSSLCMCTHIFLHALLHAHVHASDSEMWSEKAMTHQS